MSSEQLADGVNPLDAELAATWDILKGYSGRDTDLGIARRFGGAAAAYSLRDIGAMNGRVVKVRRDSGETTDPEEDFSANQVQDGTLERWVNGKLENTLPADVATAAAAYSLRKVKASYGSNAVRIRRSSDDAEVNVAFDSDNKVSTSSSISVVSGTVTETTLGDFISGTDAFVHTWYDQAGSNNAVQATAANQPKIAENGALLVDGLKFNGNSDNFTITNGVSGRSIFAVTNQNIDTTGGGLTGYGQDGISSLLGTAGTNSYIFISNNNSAFNSYAISIDGASTGDTGQYASNGGTLSATGGNLGTYGDIPSDTNSLISIIYSSGDPANAWTRLGSGISGNIFMQGSMSEVILYTTDQSDNRFKIESNINNYYGLYTFQGDGFVETWYDQSGNGNDATQATAGNQPAIVQNGGICTSNGSPSVFFTGDTRDDELDFTDLTLTDATIFTVVNIDSSADQQIILGGSASTATGTMIPMMDNGSSNTQVYKNATVGGAEQGSSQFKNGAQITLADRDDAFDNLAVNTQILFTMVDVDVAEAKVLDGISRTPSDATTFHLQGQMNELIIYNSDLSSDRGTIESDIANHYNITLS